MCNTKSTRIIRYIGIILMSLTAVFTLMGGVGTTCVALNPTGYSGKFAGIVPFQWLYILFVLVTVAIGVLGVRAVVLLVTGSEKAYRSTLTTLSAGTFVGIFHLIASRMLRGGSMPVDMVVCITVLTLIFFLLFKSQMHLQRSDEEVSSQENGLNQNVLAIMLTSTAILTLTIQFLMAPTHTINAINYADVWHLTLSLLGIGQLLTAILLGIRSLKRVRIRRHGILSLED